MYLPWPVHEWRGGVLAVDIEDRLSPKKIHGAERERGKRVKQEGVLDEEGERWKLLCSLEGPQVSL